jgi:predicted transport protein
MTHGFANLVAHRALQEDDGSADDDSLVAAQYAGPKQHLQSIYDALISYVNDLGPDVEIAPKKTDVSLRRNKQFALVQPSTRTRVDLGINLEGVDATERLEASGSFNAMVSHRVRLARVEDIEANVQAWLKQAYQQG